MKRVYHDLIKLHLKEFRQMVFLAGPRQVGKTTTAQDLGEKANHFYYYNWDVQEDRNAIIAGPRSVAEELELHLLRKGKIFIVFDKIHKYRYWKRFLKGFFDSYSDLCRIIVTGSAKLNVYREDGDRLMGRYLLYRIHPLTVGELLNQRVSKREIRKPKKIDNKRFQQLWEFGGFPEPYLKANPRFSSHWKRLRQAQLIQEDIRDLTQIQEIAGIELLANLLKESVGSLQNYSKLAATVRVSSPTIRRWLTTLQELHYCFSIKPWSQNVTRSLKKEPKYYLWDWSLIENSGARFENLIASHLHKAVHYWTDYGFGHYELYFLRDKEKREVDFLVTKDHEPWFLVEAKNSHQKKISPSLFYFQEKVRAKHAFQVALDLDYVGADCFNQTQPTIVPAKTLLSQLL